MSRGICCVSRDWLLYLDDLIAHHYFSVEPSLIFDAATRHVPALLNDALRLRQRVESGA